VLLAASCAAALPLAGVAAPGDLLPDLRADPPERPILDRTQESTPRLLLKFDGFVTNIGQAPLDVTGNPVAGTMQQRVLRGGQLVADNAVEVNFDQADGHNHWHLMRVMRYSLWNAARSAQVAPGQKVGFCLVDSQRIAGGGPAGSVYTVGANNFCGQFEPGRTSLTMGVSVGWRDLYHRDLAWQWVDVSETAPGSYFLAAEADPENRILESNNSNARAFMSSAVTVPGYVASPVGPVAAPAGRQTAVTLAAQTIGSPGSRAFRIERAPARGALNVAVGGTVSGSQVLYTPAPGYTGPDSFEFSARNTSGVGAGFPRSAARATASIQVGSQAVTTVQISGAPGSLVTGTSAQLTASVINAGPGVTWTASAGTISATGLFTAPAAVPAGGAVTIGATSVDDPSAAAQTTITIVPPPNPKPAPSGGSSATTGPITPLALKRNGRNLVVRTTPGINGRLVMTAIRTGKVLVRCRVRASAGKRVTCLLKLPRRVRTKTVRIAVGLKAADGSRATARAIARP
jgi:hypothetical protein